MVLTISAAGTPQALWWALPDNHRRMGVRTNIPTQTISFPNCPEYSSLARVVRVRYDDIGSGGCHVVADCAVDASGATCSLSHALARTRLGAIHGTSECSHRELDALHTSDHYDRMRGACRGQRRGEGCWEWDGGSWDGISLLRSALRVTPAGTHRSSQIA